ncbi:4Fe-4S binding protein [uncultured Sphaerochaeta sp.]|uniref:ATP-binding protein n=1 Tax=uncultured Sphaerochaeta sp. TaxID=886478 RepID=UPI002A0A9751|nr:4Fe-4S binding protein [uncultured Sphaerochaeta sp.]
MIRQMIKIDKEKCNGCGLCASACQEGAIGMVEGKATLLREDYCDGLGNCLPVCPTGAITFENREAPAFDHEAVGQEEPTGFSCPGSRMQVLKEPTRKKEIASPNASVPSQLSQWPVQIQLVSPKASFLQGSDLLIAADCVAYAYGDFHRKFIKDKVTLIGCPKLDSPSYIEKFTEIFQQNDIKSITVVRMEVPCCGGLSYAVQEALKACDKIIPLALVTISTNGEILR